MVNTRMNEDKYHTHYAISETSAAHIEECYRALGIRDGSRLSDIMAGQKDIPAAIRANIALIESHIPKMMDKATIERAKRTVAYLEEELKNFRDNRDRDRH